MELKKMNAEDMLKLQIIFRRSTAKPGGGHNSTFRIKLKAHFEDFFDVGRGEVFEAGEDFAATGFFSHDGEMFGSDTYFSKGTAQSQCVKKEFR